MGSTCPNNVCQKTQCEGADFGHESNKVITFLTKKLLTKVNWH